MFEWATVEAGGVPLVVEAPPGLDFLTADVARDPALTVFADFVTLFEEDPGRYEGTALTLLFDQQEDPGTYYWQASYFASPDDPAPVVGPVRSFAIGVPSGAPAVAIGLPAKLFAGRQAEVRLRYQAGSSPAADRLHLLETRSPCPAAPDGQAGRVLVDGAAPPATGELTVPVRYRRLGRVRLCAYVTAGSAVAARAAESAEVVRPPVKTSRMLRWRLGPRGLGPVRIGMRPGRGGAGHRPGDGARVRRAPVVPAVAAPGRPQGAVADGRRAAGSRAWRPTAAAGAARAASASATARARSAAAIAGSAPAASVRPARPVPDRRRPPADDLRDRSRPAR